MKMNINSKSGSGSASAFFSILFLASVALNAAFITGCISMDDFCGESKETTQTRSVQSDPNGSEYSYLHGIATSLGILTASDQSPGLIAQNIKEVFNNTISYDGDVLTGDSFEECKAAIPSTKDTETFEAYHAFIKKIAGKKILVLDN